MFPKKLGKFNALQWHDLITFKSSKINFKFKLNWNTKLWQAAAKVECFVNMRV